MHRKTFLRLLSLASLGFTGLARSLEAKGEPLFHGLGYGSLVPDPKKILNLPKGFRYKILARSGEKMNDGFLVPGRPDGMGAFAGSKGRVLLVRNHENSAHEKEHSPFGPKNELWRKLRSSQKAALYDIGLPQKPPHIGGTTTSVINEDTLKVEKCYLSLGATARNCAGGQSPWGTWLTCEEYTGRPNDGSAKMHGYVFEVKAQEKIELQKAQPIKAMGRFNHEAVAIDPRTGIVYLTEDRNDGLLYRYIPKVKGQLHKGGQLQALAFVWKSQMDTRNWQKVTVKTGKPLYAVKWIDLKNVDSSRDDLRKRGFAQGAARFARGEGVWPAEDGVYFACTNGGRTKTGQIFKYIPSKYEGQAKEKEEAYRPRLQLFLEPNNTKLLRYCDNLCVSPWGHLFFCEDSSKPRIFGVSPEAEIYPIAEQVGFRAELAGVCFSPSGKTMFVNIQDAGLTLAIQGPWAKS